MSDPYSRKILKVVVAHCSNTIGWNAVQASSLDLLTDVLHKYIYEIARVSHRYSEQFGRTEPNLDDLGLAFRDMGINIADLADYVSNVEPTPFQENLPIYPIPRESQLNFLKPGSHEVLTRPVHVHEHLPPMLPPAVEEEERVSEIVQEMNPVSPVPSAENAENGIAGATPSPRSVFKRPEMAEKRNRTWLEEEGQPLREITSVMMTTSGYLSSSREGKLPESRIPRHFLELESEAPSVPEKKVTMKKLIEGIKKSDEMTKKAKEREREEDKEKERDKEKDKEHEKEKEREREETRERDQSREAEEKEKEKEKEKELAKEKEQDQSKEKEKDKKERLKKKRKEKLMEEFNFFDEKAKDKAVVIQKASPVVESKLQSDGTKQKLNIFRKIHKTKETDQGTAGPFNPTMARSDTPVDTFEKPRQPQPSSSFDDNESMRSSPPGTPSTPRTPEVPAFSGKKIKKERKPRVKKDKMAAGAKMANERPSEDTFSSPLGPPEKIAAREERVWPKEEPVAFKDSWPPVKEDKAKDKVATTVDSMSPPKRKRGRPAKITATPESSEPPKTPEIPTSSPTMPLHVPPGAPKSFYPFSNPFAVPGLIPPPLFQNVPFNLLGITPGLRPPLGLPHIPTLGLPGASSAHPNLPNLPLSSPLFLPPVSKPEPPKPTPPPVVAPPSTRSPSKSSAIVDSLPESVSVSSQSVGLATESDDNAAAALLKKKEKREKKEKEKEKKKDKKDKKLKEKGDKDEKDKEKKIKKEKKKERKDKEKAIKAAEKEEQSLPSTPSVPKITFKFGGTPSSPRPATPEATPKLIFKAIAERMESPTPAAPPVIRESAVPSPAPPVHHPPPPDVAKFSALITRPPKTPKVSKKEGAAAAAAASASTPSVPVTPVVPAAAPPMDKPAAPSPLPSSSTSMLGAIVARTPSPSSKVRREKPQKPPKVTKDKEKEKEKDKAKKSDKPGDVAVITETVGSYYDEYGNKIWICPACGRQDDGTPMIGCDECDDWYHWVCVGIQVPPAETENWYCQRCIAKKHGSLVDKKKGRKKKSL